MPKTLEESGIILPTPRQGRDKLMAMKFALEYFYEIRGVYIAQSISGSNDLMQFLKFLDKSFYELSHNIKKSKEMSVAFAKDDVYKFGKSPSFANKKITLETIHYTARFIYDLVALFWDDEETKRYNYNKSLDKFILWLQKYANKMLTSIVRNAKKF